MTTDDESGANGGKAQNPRWARLEAQAKEQAKKLGVPVHKTPAFKTLERSCYKALERDGFQDIEYEDPTTGEPGSMLKGINTAQILAMGGPKHQEGPMAGASGAGDRGEDRPDRRAMAARLRMEAQRDWFAYLASLLPQIAKRWGRDSWRVHAMQLYAEGNRFEDIARVVRNAKPVRRAQTPAQKRCVVKNAICNELRQIRKERAEEWERLKADIRRRREEGEWDE